MMLIVKLIYEIIYYVNKHESFFCKLDINRYNLTCQ